MGDERSRAIPLYLSWVGTLCGALLLMLSDVLPFRLRFVRPETLFLCLTQVEIAFALFAWPWFLAAAAPSGRRLLIEGGVLLAAALPLALIAANVSNVGTGAFLRAQALPVVLAAAAAALEGLGRSRGWRVGPWYVLGVVLLAAFLPFVAFITGGGLSWTVVLSPFWAAARSETGAAAIFGVLAGVLFAARRFPRKAVAA